MIKMSANDTLRKAESLIFTKTRPMLTERGNQDKVIRVKQGGEGCRGRQMMTKLK